MNTDKLQSMTDASRNIVFFGGAGVSTESGIPDYRSVDGLYNQQFDYPPEVMLSHDFFCSHTEEFFRFYRAKMIAPEAKPNAAHLKLAELERAGKLSAVITQNIDGLHQAAGSTNVLELHGSVHRNYCLECGRFYPVGHILGSEGIPLCSCGGIVKPDVVLYGESLNDDTLDRAIDAMRHADMLIIGGTSMTVYPAAGLVDFFGGERIAVINKTPCSARVRWGEHIEINDSIGEVFSRVIVR